MGKKTSAATTSCRARPWRKAGYRIAAPAIRRLRLAPRAFRLYERVVGWRLAREGGSERGPDGFPIPPPRLRVLVSGGGRPETFFSSGAATAQGLKAVLAKNEIDVSRLDSILDFGCGCGRVTRHWADLDGPRIHACDYNALLVEWCRDNLPFVTTARNELEPPLPYESDSFEFVYAISVFTHLPSELMNAWMAELRRIVRPGGWVLITTHGEAFIDWLTAQERDAFEAGSVVVRFPEAPGANLCSTYLPRSWVAESLLADLELIDFLPAGELGKGRQDAYLARLPIVGASPPG